MPARDEDKQQLFNKIVQILSATVNGTLAELGHFPMSGQFLEETRKQNKEMRDVITKLHEDNIVLQRIVNSQAGQIAALQHDLDAHRHEIQVLHGQLEQVIIERDNLATNGYR